MTEADARQLLLLHGAGTSDAAGNPLVQEDGFLGSLRPYRGLVERNFHLVMEALLTVGPRFAQEPGADRELIHSVWCMCRYARAWGLHADGMLRRNKLITPVDIARLERWTDTVEDTALDLLGGRLPHLLSQKYAEYVLAFGWWENIGFFIPLMEQVVSDPDAGDFLEACVDTLGKLGGLAERALPVLREAETRSFSWYIPAERCTAEVRARLRRAIDAIEAGIRPK